MWWLLNRHILHTFHSSLFNQLDEGENFKDFTFADNVKQKAPKLTLEGSQLSPHFGAVN
jgi:hypothetical protein